MPYTEQQFEAHIEASMLKAGWQQALDEAYDKQHCLLGETLLRFLNDSQEETMQRLYLQYAEQTADKLIQRIDAEIAKRGIIDVLRHGVKDRGCHFNLIYFKPNSGLNPDHADLYKQNVFHVVRQLHYSHKNNNSIDVTLFVNGMPIITLELKNQLTGQSVLNAEKQYRQDRDPKEPLLRFGRCIAHFCVDNDRVSMTTQLNGDNTRFLPYNKGIENPIHPSGHKTTYLWEEVLHTDSILDILENFVFHAEEEEPEWDTYQKKLIVKKSTTLVFPRYHQLEVIRNLRRSIRTEGVGKNYLIQHTTGAGKSYEIAWLGHMLTSLYQSETATQRIFDSIIIVTDRKVLDAQIRLTVMQLERTKGVVHAVDINSAQLREYLQKGKDIIVTTIQKFPVISESVGELPGRSFAVIVDEVHSSQSGESSKELKKTLSKRAGDLEASAAGGPSSLPADRHGVSGAGPSTLQQAQGELSSGTDSDEQEDEEYTDIDEAILRDITYRGKQGHISFFGFTGTPKAKTLEIFGRKDAEGRFVPFHSYTMRQSIKEGFTRDVLENYTTYKRYFKLIQTAQDDVEVPTGVTRQLIQYVDQHEVTIEQKVRIILEHFSTRTVQKIKGRARAMVVTRSRKHCVLFFQEMRRQMEAMGMPYQCLIAFSGTVRVKGVDYTEAGLNNLPPKLSIPLALKMPDYRILVVANKFQTGFDEPLLHTMFVDKKLSGLQCVQTLSRLNRTKANKTDTFVLDFVNEPEEVEAAFQQYYQTTIVSGETDPNRLYSLQTEIENYNVFTAHELEQFCKVFYDKTIPDEQLQPILNVAVDRWKALPDEERRETFRSLIQSYMRLYGYISQIITFRELTWEKLYVYLNYLNKKLPKRQAPDIRDVLDAVDLDSLRLQKIHEGAIKLEEKDADLPVISPDAVSVARDPELEFLSEIIRNLNEAYGTNFTEEDKQDIRHVRQRLHESTDLHKVMVGDNTEANKRKKFDEVLMAILLSYVNDRFEFYKKMEDPKVKGYVGGMLWKEMRRRMKEM